MSELDDRTSRDLGRLLRQATHERERERRDSAELRRRDAATRQRLVEALAEDSWLARLSPSQWNRVRGAFAATALVVTALAVFWALPTSFGRSEGLDYQVGGAAEVAGYIRAVAGQATVSFEDGTVLELADGSSGRVSDVRSNGARFVLEDGTVEARVEKVADAAWSVHAGPWEVRVTGTRFAVSWDARRSALRVALREGSVVVHGPGAESGIGLRAGQLLEAGDGGSIHVTSAPETPGAAAPGETRPRDAQDADQRLGSADPGGSSGGSTGPSAGPGPAAPGLASAPADGAAGPAALAGRPWPTRVAEGDYDGVLAEAESRGLDAVLGAAPAADLAALSDAARYRGRSGLATQALEALRGRFRGTSAAANASFLLGRMADDAGSASTAIRWYDAHLGEGGAFAAEALGRKMLAVRRSRGEGPAIPVAREYLARFPEGAYAPVARTLVGEGPAGAAPSGLAPSSPIGAPPPASGERGVMPTSP